MKAGADGYLTLHNSLEELAVAIRCIAKGRDFITLSHRVVPRPKSISSHAPSLSKASIAQRQIDLSRRERQVLTLISQGMTNKQAAAEISLSIKTAETHRSRIMKKHGLQNRQELIEFAAFAETSSDEGLAPC